MGPGSGIVEERVEVDGVGVFVRRREGDGPPVVLAHGNPTHSGQWVPFLERLARPAIAFDLPGWGRSEAPARFDYSFGGLARLFGRCLDELGVGRYALVVHDWGGLALIDAIRRRDPLERLVLIDAVPLLPGYRWHWVARRFWRVPLAGELFNLAASRPAVRALLRQATPRPGSMPDEFVEMIWDAWRRGTRRPILELYRSADPARLAAAGTGLGELACPALVVWGERDPYIPARFARAYAERLPNAELELVAGAGHWPWIDRPELVDRVIRFLESE